MSQCKEHNCVCSSKTLKVIDHPKDQEIRNICDCIFHNGKIIYLIEIKCFALNRREFEHAIEQLRGCLIYIIKNSLFDQAEIIWAYVLCTKFHKFLAPLMQKLRKRAEMKLLNFVKSQNMQLVIHFDVIQQGKLFLK